MELNPPGCAVRSERVPTYFRFSDAADDVVDARVFEGIHFRFADRAGRRQGWQVANWVFSHFLRPKHGHHDDDDDHDHDDDDDDDDDH